jgi:hypothetical protein
MMMRAGVSVDDHRVLNDWEEERESMMIRTPPNDVWTYRVGVLTHLQYIINTLTERFNRLYQQRLTIALQHHTFALGVYGESLTPTTTSYCVTNNNIQNNNNNNNNNKCEPPSKAKEFISSWNNRSLTDSSSHFSGSVSSRATKDSSLTSSYFNESTVVDLQIDTELQQQLLRENVVLQHQLDTLVDQIRYNLPPSPSSFFLSLSSLDPVGAVAVVVTFSYCERMWKTKCNFVVAVIVL